MAEVTGQLYRFDIGKLLIDNMYLLLEKVEDVGDFYQLFNRLKNEGCECFFCVLMLTLTLTWNFLTVKRINLIFFLFQSVSSLCGHMKPPVSL